MEIQTLFGPELREVKPKPHGTCGCYTSSFCGKQDAIEKHFLSGKTLTVLEALKLYRTVELRKFICQLKNKGLNIVGEWKVTETSRFKVYKLVK